MDIFGISSAKIILILIIAIVLLGPDQVPTIVKTVGKTIRDFRRFVNETTKEFNEVTGDLRKEFTESVGDLRNEIAATQAELKTQFDLSDVVSPITSALRDPLGAATAPVPEPVAVGATVAAETQVAATETVPYTPPQPMADFTGPVPETPPVSPVEQVPEPFVVRAPRAESLAITANGAHNGVTEAASDAAPLNSDGNGNGNGHAAFTPPRATKADPFADLVMLAPAQATAPAPIVVSAPPESSAVPEPVAVQDSFESDTGPAPAEGLSAIPVVTAEPVPATADTVTAAPAPHVPRSRAVGGSVAGTKYGRKRAS